ncbi:CvpA family protein [Solimonas sp. SE-A11]|uniref:CvpA family protein n=1 Tax=Solimonas sp. SE-A11 TaxID=3054954 RepID=UPI00259CE1AE|nr:CvpA family protein [Solimonas sp. SE-A11]MDM4771072.1 CvpA family protein [Solimonas sp. SE-A11]
MIWVDYCIFAVFILSVAIGLLRGFTREVLGLATWLFALLLAWLLGHTLADALAGKISNPALRLGCAYLLLFLGGLLVGALVTHFVSEAVKDSFLSLPNRMVGGGYGLARAAVLTAGFVLVAGQMGAKTESWWQQSLLIGKFEWLADGLATLVPERWLEVLRPDPTTTTQTQQG